MWPDARRRNRRVRSQDIHDGDPPVPAVPAVRVSGQRTDRATYWLLAAKCVIKIGMSPSSKSPSEQLATPVQYLKGVGPDRALLLEKLNLRTARDILFFFPRDYEDMSQVCDIADLQEGVSVSICATVEEVELRNTGVGRSLLGVLLRQGTEYLRALWFNQPHMRERFRVGQRVLVAGEPKLSALRWEMTHPKVEFLADNEPPPKGRILPVYPLTEGLKQHELRRIIHTVVESYTPLLEDVFHADFLDDHHLWPIHAALPQIHEPTDLLCLEQARRRFVYQELFVMQLALARRKWIASHERQAPPLPTTAKIDARIRRLFAFELTADQEQAVREITADMARETPMNRLLQGDVGSGKTVVAEYALLVAVAHGHQAVMMAPTEVLARQHVRTLTRDLEKSKVRIALLTGTLTAAQRRETLAAIAAGDVDLIVGTHAVIQSDVEFAQLGLVVIDEQHRFGVRQRATLKQAGLAPHYLVMTATPIPRTMFMTLFGDLEVSTLRAPPPGRQPVNTYVAAADQREKWWEFFRKKLREGRQGYVIAPLVDESDSLEVSSVQTIFTQLTTGPLQEFRLGYIHGRMSAEEKEAAMREFGSGRTQVLVATSVVEVGIDVPNATLMAIENGERFGLAQLHQLRGRISRGRHPGFLCVFTGPQSAEARARLEALTRTADGFELAEIDFQLRGPGDLLGTRQHGLPPLRIADLQQDTEILEEARRDALALIQEDPELSRPEVALLARMTSRRYGAALELGDVG